MFAALELAADTPVVVGAEERWLVVIDRALGGGPDQFQSAERLRRAAHHFRDAIDAARHGHVAGARIVVPRVDEAADANVPHRARRQRVGEMGERHRGD